MPWVPELPHPSFLCVWLPRQCHFTHGPLSFLFLLLWQVLIPLWVSWNSLSRSGCLKCGDSANLSLTSVPGRTPPCLTYCHALPSSFQSLTLFLSDLAQYFQGQGPLPKYQATLHFWDGSPSSSHTQENLITVRVSSAPGWSSVMICLR